jgi:peptidoglycan/xylan/chitin deacetylase (PgdA/CDA1 family)
MPGCEFPLGRRAFIVRSAVAVAAASAYSTARIARGQTPARDRKVVVTIDDGPATGVANDLDSFVRISDALRASFAAEKVPAIMFINERQLNVDGQRDARVGVLHRWLDAGLDLGNHTYSHPNLGNITPAQFMDDVIKGEVISRPLLEARGKKLVWFRYPFLASGTGDTARIIEEFLLQRSYKIAPVSADYRDYSFAGTYARHIRAGDATKAAEHFAMVMKMLDEGFARAETRSMEVLGYELPQTLLIHCNEMNSLTLPATLQRIRDRGYRFVSMDEAIEDPAYKMPGIRPGGLGGGGLFNSLAAAKRSAESRL